MYGWFQHFRSKKKWHRKNDVAQWDIGQNLWDWVQNVRALTLYLARYNTADDSQN
jgi:hypothetical protein